MANHTYSSRNETATATLNFTNQVHKYWQIINNFFNSLSSRTIIYISIGCGVFLILLIILLCCCCCRKRKKKKEKEKKSISGPIDEILEDLYEAYDDVFGDEEAPLLVNDRLQKLNEEPPLETLSQRKAMSMIKEEGFESQFASKARAKISFELNHASRMIVGCIKTIEGLDFDDEDNDPEEICFHARMIPKRRKQKAETKWKAADSKVFSLTFLLGPFKKDINPRKKIRLRLYGRRRRNPFSVKCYGETFMNLSKIFEKNGSVTRVKRLHPRTENSIEEESPFVDETKYDDDEEETIFGAFTDALEALPSDAEKFIENLLESGSESDKDRTEKEERTEDRIINEDEDLGLENFENENKKNEENLDVKIETELP